MLGGSPGAYFAFTWFMGLNTITYITGERLLTQETIISVCFGAQVEHLARIVCVWGDPAYRLIQRSRIYIYIYMTVRFCCWPCPHRSCMTFEHGLRVWHPLLAKGLRDNFVAPNAAKIVARRVLSKVEFLIIPSYLEHVCLAIFPTTFSLSPAFARAGGLKRS